MDQKKSEKNHWEKVWTQKSNQIVRQKAKKKNLKNSIAKMKKMNTRQHYQERAKIH
jgi:hypothetical protein